MQRKIRKVNWVRIYEQQFLPPDSVTMVKVEADEEEDAGHSLLSLFDGDRTNFKDGDVYVPSLWYGESTGSTEYVIPVANQSWKTVDLYPGFIIGELVGHKTNARMYGAETYLLRDVLELIQERNMWNGDEFICNFGNTGVHQFNIDAGNADDSVKQTSASAAPHPADCQPEKTSEQKSTQ